MSALVAPDIVELASSVEIMAPHRFQVRHSIVDSAEEHVRTLAHALYEKCYCRPQVELATSVSGSLREARDLLARYTVLNKGKGTMEPGWHVVRLDPIDGRCVVEKRGITLWVDESRYESTKPPTVGARIRIWVPKELRQLIPGFYAFVGDAPDRADDEGAPASRFYWHITRDGAPDFVESVSATLNRAEVPFHAKVLKEPDAFRRADAAVLYLKRQELVRAWPLLDAIYNRLRPYLRETVPMCTHRLAPGLAVADEIGETISFGLNRCELIATGLLASYTGQVPTLEEKLAGITEAFVDAGLSISEPYLRSAQSPRYPKFP